MTSPAVKTKSLAASKPLGSSLRRYASLLMACFALALLSACGDGTPALVTLTVTPSSPQTLHVNQSLTLNTSVQNYSSSTPLNVTWALTCTGGCGTVIPNYTVVGQSVMYTAPSAPPSGVVTLTADLLYGHAGPPIQVSITVVP
jgi:hypothetical protein